MSKKRKITRGATAPWAAVAYLTGIACPHCLAEADERCVTNGGYPYSQEQGAHARRIKAAQDGNVELTWHEPPGPPPSEPGEAGKLQGLKLALWYVTTAGSAERAKALLNAACEALAQVPDTTEEVYGHVWCDHHGEIHADTGDPYDIGEDECSADVWRTLHMAGIAS